MIELLLMCDLCVRRHVSCLTEQSLLSVCKLQLCILTAASVISPPGRAWKREGSKHGVCGHTGAENTEHGLRVQKDTTRESGERTGIYCVIFTALSINALFSAPESCIVGPDFPTSPRSASHDSVYVSPLVTGLPLKKEKTEVCFNVPLISRIK